MLMSDKIKRVDDVVEWRLCMGCGACAWACPSHAISLIDIVEKGIRPVVDESLCEKCQDCLSVCPGISLTHKAVEHDEISELSTSWGPVLSLHEGYASEDEVRWAGSSGGIVSALAIHAVEELGYEGVLHIKADPDNPICNIPVISRSREDIVTTLGSRYAPAAPCQAFGLMLEGEGPFMFIGKPCDVAALRKAQEMTPELKQKVGLVVSIFCAGTPTTYGTEKVLERMGVEDKSDVSEFHYRGCGWPGNARAKLKNGSEANSITYGEAWDDVLSKHGQLRCRLCPDSTGEFSDISCGDPWYREVKSDEKGRSLVVIRTQHGQQFWEGAMTQCAVISEPAQAWMLPGSQESVHVKRKQVFGRIQAMIAFGIPAPEYLGFSLRTNWMLLPFMRRIRVYVATIKRIILRRLYKSDK